MDTATDGPRGELVVVPVPTSEGPSRGGQIRNSLAVDWACVALDPWWFRRRFRPLAWVVALSTTCMVGSFGLVWERSFRPRSASCGTLGRSSKQTRSRPDSLREAGLSGQQLRVIGIVSGRTRLGWHYRAVRVYKAHLGLAVRTALS